MRWLWILLVVTGCAGRAPRVQPGLGVPERPPTEAPATPEGAPQELEDAFERRVEAVLARGASLHGQSRVHLDGEDWRADCSGFVAACYAPEADLTDPDLATASIAQTMWRTLERRGLQVEHPRPGDLVFFDDTHDKNGNGLRDDPLSHVGLVESVDAEGTVTFLHFASGRVKRDVLNLLSPGVHRGPEGQAWNAFLRRGKSGERLAGQLLRGFARPL